MIIPAQNMWFEDFAFWLVSNTYIWSYVVLLRKFTIIERILTMLWLRTYR